MKDHKAILEKYQSTDEHGHPLETCQDYLDLLDEHERMREALEAVVYDSKMKADRWGLWRKCRQALGLSID